MNALALDLGTKTGFAWSVAGEMAAGTWTLANDDEVTELIERRMDRRLDPRIPKLFDAIRRVHQTKPLDWMFFEDVQFAKTTQQAQLWSSLRAAVWLAAWELEIQIECCPVGTLKKFGSGYGAANKNGMGYALTKNDSRFTLKNGTKVYDRSTGLFLDDNAVDAIHLLRWGLKLIENCK